MKHKSLFSVVNKEFDVITPDPHSPLTYSDDTRVFWGLDDKYPEFLFNLYKEQPLLYAAVEATASASLFPEIARSLIIYGSAAIDKNNKLLDARYLRWNKSRTKFWYKSPSMRTYSHPEVVKLITMDCYDVYPLPLIHRCITPAQTLIEIAKHGLASSVNSFNASTFISMNNGLPDEDTRDEIEELLTEKFCGSTNAGRVAISYATDKEHSAEVHQLQSDDYFARFSTAKEFAESQILQTFRCTKTLLGIVDGVNSGFNENEYENQFKLFKKFTIDPLDEKIANQIKNNVE